MFTAKIYDGRMGNHAPYIYCVLSNQFNCIYIGQTISQLGSLGRLAQHLSNTNSNTFIQRICSVNNFDEVILNDIDFFASKLPEKTPFLSRATDYREAVEYLINYGVINSLKEKSINLSVISRTKSNAYTKLDSIKKLAENITCSIVDWIVANMI